MTEPTREEIMLESLKTHPCSEYYTHTIKALEEMIRRQKELENKKIGFCKHGYFGECPICNYYN